MLQVSDLITDSQAARAIAAAQAQAASMGVAVNIAILDHGAYLKSFIRMDGAVLGSIDLAIGKARTAALFAASSEAIWEYCKPGAPAHNLQASNGQLFPFPGGLPLISRGGTLVGAVGVSGGTVPQDFGIARAAVAAFTD